MKIAYKWAVLALLSGAFFFHQADRALFGLLTKPIQDELLLTDVQIGWINTVLSWTLAALTMVAGFVGDKFSRKWIITISLFFWSLMTVCMGFVGQWKILGFVIPAYLVVMFFRSIATGGGESFYAPSAMALLGSHHKETRSIAFSVHQGTLYFALMISGVLVSAALHFLNWRQIFILFGAAGVLLAFSFIWLLKDERCENAPSDKSHKGLLVSGFKAFFANPAALCVTVGFVAIVFVNNAYLFWAPKFIAEKFAVNVGEAAEKAMLYHHFAAFVAVMAGGFITDRFVRKMPRFRLVFQAVTMLLGAPCLVMIGMSGSLALMIAMTASYGLFRGLFESNTHASLFDVVHPAFRSSAEGYLTMVGFFFGGLSGVVMGILSEKYGVRGFEIGFALMGAAYAVGAVAMALSFFFFFKKFRVSD
jgi:MFS family permease